MPVLKSTRNLKRFYKQTFEIKRNGKTLRRHTLLINPEDMEVDEPARTSIAQTLGGVWLDDFGSGVVTITMSGITGYRKQKNTDGITRDGYTELKHLRNEMYRKFIRYKNESYTMFWYDWENEEYYEIFPTRFRLARNRSQPMLYRYTIEFTCLRNLSKGGAKPKYENNDLLIPLQAQSAIFGSLSNSGEIIDRIQGNRG